MEKMTLRSRGRQALKGIEAGEGANKNILPALPQDVPSLTGVEGSGREEVFPESVPPPTEAIESGRSTPTIRSGLGPAPSAGSKKADQAEEESKENGKTEGRHGDGASGGWRVECLQRMNLILWLGPRMDFPVPAPSALAPLKRNFR